VSSVRARELLRRLPDGDLAGLSSSGLAARIGDLVRGGQLAAGVDLPSERDLAEAIGRSRGTIARAYERLREEGLAHTRQGAGTTIGCCVGPWASSRAADLVPILSFAESGPDIHDGRTIDLRGVRWSPELVATSATGSDERARDAGGRTRLGGGLTGQIDEHLAGLGLQADPAQVLLTSGRLRAIDVALTTLVRPGEPVLLPERTDPGVLALLRVRGFRPAGLPLDGRGRPDVPGWLRRIRTRPVSVVLLSATHAAPHGTVLAAHERQLLAEALADADASLIDDVTDADLWVDAPPPPPMAAFDADGGDRTITLGEAIGPTESGGPLGWLYTPNGVLAERVHAVAVALDAIPRDASDVADESGLALDALVRSRRQHIVDHTAALIRAVTPAAPLLSVAAAEGGPVRWIGVGDIPGSRIADAARTRGVLVNPGVNWQAVDATDPPAVTVSLTGSTQDLLTGVRVLIETVQDLA
jgi:DNA-binding transcriptional MocR family regulator